MVVFRVNLAKNFTGKTAWKIEKEMDVNGSL
jgi:hypothetical protein